MRVGTGQVALVYEITNNPHFDPRVTSAGEPASTLVRPSEINRLVEAFKANGHQVVVIDGPVELIARAAELSRSCRYVFNKSIGFAGLERKVAVPAICYLYKLPLVGSGAYAMTLARHKYHTNRLLAGMGYRVPSAVSWAEDVDAPQLSGFMYPAIVKPNHESDCLGITVDSVIARELDALARVRYVVANFKQPAVIEEFVPGEELRVPVIGNGVEARGIGCVGVMKNGKPLIGAIQTWEDQSSDRLDYYDPALSSSLLDQLRSLAAAIHRAMGLNDYSRVDFRLDASGQPVCMEVSTHPELTVGCSFVRACLSEYAGYDAIVGAILDAAD